MHPQLAPSGPPTTTPLQRHRPNMPCVQSSWTAQKDKPCHVMPQKKDNLRSMLADNENNPHSNSDQQPNKNDHTEGHHELDLMTLQGDSTAQTTSQRQTNKSIDRSSARTK